MKFVPNSDALWMSVCTILVLMMTLPGLIMFYAGLVRRKNALFIAAQIFSVTAVVTLTWLAVGYSLAFTSGNSVIGGLSRAFGNGLLESSTFTIAPTVPEELYFIFQLAFAIITAALVIGATAERMRMSVTIAFSILWVVVVYAPVAHWIWHPAGWLSVLGHLDWAGGTVVHITAGASGLVAALALGGRSGFPNEPMPPHNLMLTALGACFLWLGWLGFNGGGSQNFGSASTVQVLLVTFMSGCVGALVWAMCEAMSKKKVTALGLMTGTLVGLVSITPAAGYVGLNAAIVLPASAAVMCWLALYTVKNKLLIDDSLDVFALHGVGGIVGTLLTPMFATDNVREAMTHTLANAVGAVAVIIYAGLLTWGILWVIRPFTSWRVSELAEKVGLDLSELGETLEQAK